MTPHDDDDDKRARTISRMQFAVAALVEARDHMQHADVDIGDEDLIEHARIEISHLVTELALGAARMER